MAQYFKVFTLNVGTIVQILFCMLLLELIPGPSIFRWHLWSLCSYGILIFWALNSCLELLLCIKY